MNSTTFARENRTYSAPSETVMLVVRYKLTLYNVINNLTCLLKYKKEKKRNFHSSYLKEKEKEDKSKRKRKSTNLIDASLARTCFLFVKDNKRSRVYDTVMIVGINTSVLTCILYEVC